MGAGEHGYSAFVDADALTAALGRHRGGHHRPDLTGSSGTAVAEAPRPRHRCGL